MNLWLQHEKFQSEPGSRVGTPAYLAPEVILTTRGKTYDGKVSLAFFLPDRKNCIGCSLSLSFNRYCQPALYWNSKYVVNLTHCGNLYCHVWPDASLSQAYGLQMILFLYCWTSTLSLLALDQEKVQMATTDMESFDGHNSPSLSATSAYQDWHKKSAPDGQIPRIGSQILDLPSLRLSDFDIKYVNRILSIVRPTSRCAYDGAYDEASYWS